MKRELITRNERLNNIGEIFTFGGGRLKPQFVYDIGIVIEDWYFCGIVESGMFQFLHEYIECQ